MSMFVIKTKHAFTLAEVLITLTIIGVIAAITIPSLLQNMDNQQNKTAWKKAYSEMEQAYMNIKRENGGSIDEYFGGESSTESLVSLFYKQFSTIETDLSIPGLANMYKTLDNQTVPYSNFSYGKMVQNRGWSVFFRTWHPDRSVIMVDINGHKKGPNVLGKDLFGAILTKDWIKPIGAEGTLIEDPCDGTPATC